MKQIRIEVRSYYPNITIMNQFPTSLFVSSKSYVEEHRFDFVLFVIRPFRAMTFVWMLRDAKYETD